MPNAVTKPRLYQLLLLILKVVYARNEVGIPVSLTFDVVTGSLAFFTLVFNENVFILLVQILTRN